jgi:hypothetical protein
MFFVSGRKRDVPNSVLEKDRHDSMARLVNGGGKQVASLVSWFA